MRENQKSRRRDTGASGAPDGRAFGNLGEKERGWEEGGRKRRTELNTFAADRKIVLA